ncbi:MAG: Peptidase family protein [Fibrobacteres bacterium]|nr:Peptidase family protein [Fibrobacterota bacterium]
MKINHILLCIVVCSGWVHGKKVAENDALDIGRSFISQTGSGALGKTNHTSIAADLRLIYTEQSRLQGNAKTSPPTALYYILSAKSKGFVIVSGDDNVAPILAYSDESGFDPGRIPPNAAKWMEGYKTRIRHILRNNIQATKGISEDWNNLRAGPLGKRSAQSSANGVDPLVKTKWNQSPYYNEYAPGLEPDPSGCVATAMVQIMKYWNYPANGAGFHSYNHEKYGTLSANFGNDTYLWGSMPDVVTSRNPEVAKIMHDAGISVDMQYGPANSGGSRAWVVKSDGAQSAENALTTYFSYKNTLKGIKRASYSNAQWTSSLKGELDARRPVLYAGWSGAGGGGHAFVCDGYDANDFFHFNWGWGGVYNGFFSIDNMKPDGIGTGGGSGEYNDLQQAIIGIEPPATTLSTGMALYAQVTPSASAIYYGASFSVSTNIINNGNGSFNGDFCAAIFDDSSNFIDYVETITGAVLAPGNVYQNNLVFSNPGLFTILPQRCTIGIFYRPTGGEWVAVSPAGSYTNFAPLDVVNPSPIEMYSSMTITPGSVFTQGTPLSVKMNVQNTGLTSFVGQYQLNLYNLDGSFAETIGTYDESAGLEPTFVYGAPFLNFSSNIGTVNPGTYLLCVVYKETSAAEWTIVGSSHYKNPVKIIVQEAPMTADRFEPNDKTAQARDLPVLFSGNVATITTTGASIHNGTDYDYYRMTLPSNGNYKISARLRDTDDDANPLTLDGLFSYSTDSNSWSDAYDDVMPDSVLLLRGGVVFFQVAPLFSGSTGTYALEINVSMNGLGVNRDILGPGTFKIFPNPAKDFVAVNLNGFNKRIDKIEILDLHGKTGFSETNQRSDKLLMVPLKNLGEGQYYLQLHADHKTYTQKFKIVK